VALRLRDEESGGIAYQGVLHTSDDLWNLVERCIYLDSLPAVSYSSSDFLIVFF